MAEDDLRDVLGDEYADLSAEPGMEGEAAPASAESSNRTFIIGVAVLAGLLLCAIGAFLVVQLLIRPRMQANQIGQQAALEMTATSQAIEVAMLNATATAEALLTEPPTAEPTATPEPPTPTATPVLGPTPTATPSPTVAAGSTPGVSAQVTTPTATASPRRTPTPTPRPPTPTPRTTTAGAVTPKPGATPKLTTNPGGAQQTPDTGLGEVLLVAAAGVLVGIIFLARRLRKT